MAAELHNVDQSLKISQRSTIRVNDVHIQTWRWIPEMARSLVLIPMCGIHAYWKGERCDFLCVCEKLRTMRQTEHLFFFVPLMALFFCRMLAFPLTILFVPLAPFLYLIPDFERFCCINALMFAKQRTRRAYVEQNDSKTFSTMNAFDTPLAVCNNQTICSDRITTKIDKMCLARRRAYVN